MTISVYHIEGRRGQACNNNALSVVRNEREVLDIIPASDLPAGTGAQQVRLAFADAVRNAPQNAPAEAIKRTARQTLGLHFT